MSSFAGDAIAVSKYFEKFQRLIKDHPGAMTLKGDHVLIERLPAVEIKTKAGLVIPGSIHTHRDTMADLSTDFGIVLMTGPGMWTDDNGDIPCDAKPGDVILLPSSVQWYSVFGHIAGYEPFSIGRVRDGQIPMWFGDYRKAFEVLSG